MLFIQNIFLLLYKVTHRALVSTYFFFISKIKAENYYYLQKLYKMSLRNTIVKFYRAVDNDNYNDTL